MAHDPMNDYKKAKAGGVGTALGAALVGAAVGAAAAYMSNSDNRKKLMAKTDEVKNKASEWVDVAAEKTGDALKDAGEKVKSSKKRSDTVVDDSYSSPTDTTF